jgi:hypothetical protein
MSFSISLRRGDGMSEDGDSWLKSAFGLDIEQVMPQLGGEVLAYAGPAPAGAALFEQIVAGSATALSEAAPVVAGGTAVGGVAAGAAIAGGVVIGVAAPLVVGYLVEHGKELDEQGDVDERQLPGGLAPDLSPDGGVVDPPSMGPQDDPDVPLPFRPTEPGPPFDPTLPAPMDPAPDFENPSIPRPPRVPEFSPEELELSNPVSPGAPSVPDELPEAAEAPPAD